MLLKCIRSWRSACWTSMPAIISTRGVDVTDDTPCCIDRSGSCTPSPIPRTRQISEQHSTSDDRSLVVTRGGPGPYAGSQRGAFRGNRNEGRSRSFYPQRREVFVRSDQQNYQNNQVLRWAGHSQWFDLFEFFEYVCVIYSFLGWFRRAPGEFEPLLP